MLNGGYLSLPGASLIVQILSSIGNLSIVFGREINSKRKKNTETNEETHNEHKY